VLEQSSVEGLQQLLDMMRPGVDSRGPYMPTAERAVVLESLVDSLWREAASEAEAQMGACPGPPVPSPFAGRRLVDKPTALAHSLWTGLLVQL